MAAVATIPPSPKRLMTAGEFLTFCERPENDGRLFELVRGEVVEMSRPTKMHGIVVSNISFELSAYARRVGPGYSVAGDAGGILERDPDTVRGPDVAYYVDVEKFADVEKGWAETPPVLAVEIRSPNDKERELLRKVRQYLSTGVKVVWVVDYEERFVTVYRPKQDLTLLDETDTISPPELPGFSCRVADFFKLPNEAKQPSAP